MLSKLRSFQPLIRTFTSSSAILGGSSTPLSPLPVTPGPVQSVSQAPNNPEPWSTSQQPRPPPKSSPRFEQTAYEYQPAPPSAMEMVNSQPIILSDARIAVCDGGECLLRPIIWLIRLILTFLRRGPSWSPENFHQSCKSPILLRLSF